ncbi:MAG: hypothetical protein LBF78_03800, partial [Treponema sp.]|nr:hypothetical protein [Treponema sp.]
YTSVFRYGENNYPVWIIRNGLNDNKQNTSTTFESVSGNQNGAVPYEVFAVDPDDDTTWPEGVTKPDPGDSLDPYILATLSDGTYGGPQTKDKISGGTISFKADQDVSGADLYYVVTQTKPTDYAQYEK